MFTFRPCRRHLCMALALAILLASQAACALGAAPQPTVTPAPSDTPMPSATPLPTATDTPTPSPTPTQTPDYKATRQAKLTATMEAKIASISPVLAELGLSTDVGELAWYAEDPTLLAVGDYNSFTCTQIGEDKVGDFVFHSEVTWDTSSGLAGCGLLLRSDGNIDTGRHYEFDLLRLQYAPAWEMFYVKYHYIESYLTRYKFDNGIHDDKDSTNTIDLVAQGKQFTPYINGEKKITLENSELTDGYIYAIAHQESGFTTCNFKNTWIWSLDE